MATLTTTVQFPFSQLMQLCEDTYKRVLTSNGAMAVINDAWYTLFGVYSVLPKGADKEYVGSFMTKIQSYTKSRAS